MEEAEMSGTQDKSSQVQVRCTVTEVAGFCRRCVGARAWHERQPERGKAGEWQREEMVSPQGSERGSRK
jgi:hypothetical protein